MADQTLVGRDVTETGRGLPKENWYYNSGKTSKVALFPISLPFFKYISVHIFPMVFLRSLISGNSTSRKKNHGQEIWGKATQ